MYVDIDVVIRTVLNEMAKDIEISDERLEQIRKDIKQKLIDEGILNNGKV